MNRELYLRSATALVIGTVIIGATMLGKLPSHMLVLLICTLCSFELITICLPSASVVSRITFTAFSMLPLLVIIVDTFQPESSIAVIPMSYYMYVLPLLLGVYFIVLIASGSFDIYTHLSVMALSLLLFTSGGIFAVDLIEWSPMVMLSVFILLWANDVFAYLIGSKFGKTKLAPSISPGKTWEGVVGGGVFSLLTGYCLSLWLTELSTQEWLVMSFLVVVFGTLGDLLQSVVKRHYQVKDSGSILPGHGGFWDRFDSFIGCIPFVSAYIILLSS